MNKLTEQVEVYKRLKQNNNSVDQVPAVDSKEVAQVDGDSRTDDPPKGNEDTLDNKDEKYSSDIDLSSSEDNNISKDAKPTESETRKKSTYLSSSKSESSSSSSDDDSSSGEDDSSSGEDEIEPPSNDRSRGKGRRGRRDRKPQDQIPGDKEAEVGKSEVISPPDAYHEDTNTTTPTDDSRDEDQTSSKKTHKKDDKRRCIGRKPVTDYVIGNTYSGKVKYIKPKLGAFIDIGSHSDAFCHISCVSDEFVSNVEDVLTVDDEVDNLRVVEINRVKKRITVSLRSEESCNDGREGGNGGMKISPEKAAHVRFDAAESKSETNWGGSAYTSIQISDSKPNIDITKEQKEFAAISYPALSGQHRGADLKRERKLARRAERRAAREELQAE